MSISMKGASADTSYSNTDTKAIYQKCPRKN